MNKPIKAICVMTNVGTKKMNSGKKVEGYILLEEDVKKKATKIVIRLKGLSQGLHGFHIHKSGDLRNSCKSLCGHYNPHKLSHGGPKDKERHVGDLGNIKPNSKGVVSTTFYDKLVKLRGKYSVVGRSIVVHDKEDDLGTGENKESKITGNAGSRIGCGIIGLV